MALSANDHQELKDLELSLLDPDTRRSPKSVAALLADEFIEFGASGEVYDKHQTIEAIAQPGTNIVATEFTVRSLALNVALLTYKSMSGSGEHRRHALRSSIWKRTDDGWQLVFHQGTPMEAPQT